VPAAGAWQGARSLDREERVRSHLAVVAAVAALAAGAGGPVPAASAASATVVVNELYGGGGNSGAPFANDFVELANRGDTAVSVDGWSVQYHSSSATGAWQITTLSGSIPAGGRYLVGEGQGAGSAAPLPTTQASGTIAMSATSGTVAVVSSAAALTCTDSAACGAAAVDLAAARRTRRPSSARTRRTPTTTPPTSSPPHLVGHHRDCRT